MLSSSATRKPKGTPKRWPNSTEDDLAALPSRIVMLGEEQQFSFGGNSIKTSKYEWYNFLPKFLMEEFDPNTKLANVYFLIICCLQLIRPISNTNGYPTTGIPLIGVLIISSILKVLEDSQRHKADTLANSSIAEVYDANQQCFVERLWSEIQVGDYIRVRSRDPVPADLVVLQVWEPSPENPKGACYVETKSLDGETNLKFRSTPAALVGRLRMENDISKLAGGRVVMEHPNNLIDSFTGVMEHESLGRVRIIIA